MNHLYCGIDIAKGTAMFCIIGDGFEPLAKPMTFKNKAQGFRDAIKWMRGLAKPFKPFDIHVVMEATGVYYLSAAKFFHDQTGFAVSVINPAQIKSFAQAKLVRTKTDSVDATVIARFGAAMKPGLWTPPTPHEEEMLGIVRHIEAVKEMIQAERNRLHALEEIGDSTASVQKEVRKHIRFLEKQTGDLTGRLKQLTKEHPETDENVKLLCSIPGVSDTTAHNLLAEMGDISRFTGVKQLVAFAGLAPAERQSGSSVRGKVMLNKRGSRRLRKSLYMPAVVASMHNPDVKELYQRLKAAGKKPMCAMVACMRKLLHIAYGVLKNRTPYEPAVNRLKTA